MVAIFILSVSVATMLGITASSASSARYANNEITANYLLQEAVDSIRNSRDTMVFQNNATWDEFLNRYGYSGGSDCFSDSGCILYIDNFDPENIHLGDDVKSCSSTGVCPNLSYDDEISYKTFYNYTSGYESEFKRTVNMEVDSADNPDQLKVVVKVEWYNGNETNKRSQSLAFYLLNWQKN
jgi:acetyltransferase-like isoleucine patch superfamily enzyme